MTTTDETQAREYRARLLAERLRKTRRPASGPVPRAEGTAVPLGPMQTGLWVNARMEPDSAAYTIGFGIRVRGPLTVAQIRSACQALTSRYDILRAHYPTDEAGDPLVVIAPPGAPDVPLGDLRSARTPESAAEDELSQLLRRPFDVEEGPLVRFRALVLAEDDHVLLFTAHHLLVDGWSVSLIKQDLVRALGQAVQGVPIDLGARPLQYEDVAVHEASESRVKARERALTRWKTNLRGVENLELDIARPRPATISSRGRTHEFTLPDAQLGRLRSLAAEEGATLYMAMLALYQVLLARHSSQRDFAIGTSVANRSSTAVESVVGNFVNMVAMRTSLNGDPTFRELLARARSVAVEAFSVQSVPFDDVVRALGAPRSVNSSPVFQVSLSVNQLDTVVSAGERAAGPLTFSEIGAITGIAHFDLGLTVVEENERCIASFTYRTDLLDADRVELLAARLVRLLKCVVDHPDAPVLSHDLRTDAERELVNARWGVGPRRPREPDCVLHELVQPGSDTDLGAAAIVEGTESLSAEELRERAARVSRLLAHRGVGPDVLVAVALKRAVPAAVCILGILGAGGAYLPLDPDLPRDRLSFILEDSGAVMCLHDGTLDVDAPVPLLSHDELMASSHEATPVAAGLDNLAYVIYTSGTTGRPKGVEVSQREIVRYLRDISSLLQVQPGATYALLQSLAFDFSLLMFYLPLVNGGTLHVGDGRMTAVELAQFLERHQVDYLKMTPSHLATMTAQVEMSAVVPRRTLVLAGEGAPSSWAAELAAKTPCRIVNSYGPTETVVACTVAEVRPDIEDPGAVWPVGSPMPGVRAYVLDEGLRPVLPGVRGELYIAGRLARGYLSRPGLTASRFVADPAGEPGERMYRTGDVVSWRNDGQLAFHGRTDDQIKIRGYRVELSEVESALEAVEGVAQCVVDLRSDSGIERLIGWIRWDEDAAPLPDASIRSQLESVLPEYMVPRVYASVDSFRMKGHGKIDRRALVAPERGKVSAEAIAPRTELEAAVASVYAELLEIDTPSVVADFFDLGGDSLLATKVVPRLHSAIGDDVVVSVMDVISNPTVEGLARLIEDKRRGGSGTRLLYELTPPLDAATRTASVIAVPYGGANASVFTDLARELPKGYSLYSLEPPGHDPAVGGEVLPMPEMAREVVDEILERVTGSLILYGHCVPGSAAAAAIAEELTRRGRDFEALYVGGAFPVARPTNKVLAALARLSARDRLTSDRNHANWLAGMGADMSAMDEKHAEHMVKVMRQDGRFAEDYFTQCYSSGVQRFGAPVISVIGEADQTTQFWEERCDEWALYSDRVASVCIQEAGHYFLNFRANELAEIITSTHVLLKRGEESSLTRAERGPESTWWLHDSRVARERAEPGSQPRLDSALPGGRETGEVLPGLGKFAIITTGQMLSFTGSTLTGFALPLWVLTQTKNLALFGVVGVLGTIPNLIVSPIAGAVVDRFNRRRLIMLFDSICMAMLSVLLVLAATGTMRTWNMMLVFGLVACAVTFQRVAFQSAIPQIVPKRYLGHANGMLQFAIGVANFIAPLFGVGLLAVFELPGILLFDVLSYIFAIGTVLFIKFPAAHVTVNETIWEEIRGGFRFSMRNKYFRAMLVFFAVINLFLAPLISLVNPLVLSFATLREVAVVAAVAGAAGIIGGLAMSVWGGPKHRRMDAVRALSVILGLSAILVAARPAIIPVCVGVFLISGLIVVVNGVVMTIIQTKVPARIQGRVFAINTMVSTAAAPLGFGVLAPQGTVLMEWMLKNVPGLAPVVHLLLGDGPGRPIAMLYTVCGLAAILLVVGTRRWTTLVRFDDEVLDARADDLIGLAQSRARRRGEDVVRLIEETGELELEKKTAR